MHDEICPNCRGKVYVITDVKKYCENCGFFEKNKIDLPTIDRTTEEIARNLDAALPDPPLKMALPEAQEGQIAWRIDDKTYDLDGNPIDIPTKPLAEVEVTPLDVRVAEFMRGKPRHEIEKMLLDEWRSAYYVDFKTTLDDDFQMQLAGVKRFNLSALIYPKSLRKMIKMLMIRSAVTIRPLTKDDIERFRGTPFWTNIAKGLIDYPHDDFYFVVLRSDMN